ncbi:MAG: isocitrate/isopropylmalate family dehydrogenase, partial [Sphaerochaetaceae bacterium]|nr:isocitrate/isopropylmalate family dehydrogenase [Sphaerochaetaceae bacterium]
GSAPDITNQDIANPIATILSVAMMLRYSFNLLEEAERIEKAVYDVLDQGYRTSDIYSEGTKKVGTKEMGRLICDAI